MTKSLGVLALALVIILATAIAIRVAQDRGQTASKEPAPTWVVQAQSTQVMPALTATPPQESNAPQRAPVATSTSPPMATEVLLPSPATPDRPAPWERPGHKYGIHLLLDDGRNHWLEAVWPQHVAAARDFVGEGGYVLQLIRLDDLDPRRWQFFMNLCAQERVVPIIRLASTFDHKRKWWEAPPQDAGGKGYGEVAAEFRDFLAQLHWPTQTRYVIVGNEPNRGDEWSNQPNPAQYAQFLLDVGEALHSVGITVLAPALDLYAPHSNGQLINGHRYIDAATFLDEMAAAQPRAFDVIDVWAAHAYPLDPFRADPSRQTFQIDYAHGATNPRHQQPPEGIPNRGVNSYRWELWKLEQIIGPRAADLPVLITESGWRHAVTQDPDARDSVHAEISLGTLSAYVDLAFHGNHGRYPNLPETGWTPWNDDPQVLGAVMFALGGYPPDWGHSNWVVLDGQGEITEAYPLALQK